MTLVICRYRQRPIQIRFELLVALPMVEDEQIVTLNYKVRHTYVTVH